MSSQICELCIQICKEICPVTVSFKGDFCYFCSLGLANGKCVIDGYNEYVPKATFATLDRSGFHFWLSEWGSLHQAHTAPPQSQVSTHTGGILKYNLSWH